MYVRILEVMPWIRKEIRLPDHFELIYDINDETRKVIAQTVTTPNPIFAQFSTPVNPSKTSPGSYQNQSVRHYGNVIEFSPEDIYEPDLDMTELLKLLPDYPTDPNFIWPPGSGSCTIFPGWVFCLIFLEICAILLIIS